MGGPCGAAQHPHMHRSTWPTGYSVPPPANHWTSTAVLRPGVEKSIFLILWSGSQPKADWPTSGDYNLPGLTPYLDRGWVRGVLQSKHSSNPPGHCQPRAGKCCGMCGPMYKPLPGEESSGGPQVGPEEGGRKVTSRTCPTGSGTARAKPGYTRCCSNRLYLQNKFKDYMIKNFKMATVEH